MQNYFDLFDLAISFEVDASALTKKYYELNKLYHPDKFTLASAEEQEAALKKSTAVNEGYKILKKQQPRLRHILALLGAEPEEGKEVMPQDFLMEMMDVNEAIMDYKMEPNADGEEAIRKQVADLQLGLDKEFQAAREDFDFEEPSSDKLLAIKNSYLKNKYLKRVLDNLQDNEAEM